MPAADKCHAATSPLSVRWLCKRLSLYDFVLKSPMLVDHLGILRLLKLDWVIASDLTDISLQKLQEHRISLDRGWRAVRSYRYRAAGAVCDV
eukprot:3066306-Rhodomonas_salina.3